MKRCIRIVFVTACAVLSFAVCPLPAAEIAIIKSGDLVPYNLAVEGFKQQVKADFGEYNLNGMPDKLPKILREIKQHPPKLIFAVGTLAAIKVCENIHHIPIIYTLVLNPESKNLRGNNITGISIEVRLQEQISALKRLVPGIKKIGVLYSSLTENLIAEADQDAVNMGLELIAVKLNTPDAVPASVRELITRVDSLLLVPDSIVVNQDSLHYMLLLSLENNIPFVVYNKKFVKEGALLGPVVNYTDIGQQAGGLCRRILQGEKIPANIILPERVEWAINLNVAQNMGMKIPSQVLTMFEHIYK